MLNAIETKSKRIEMNRIEWLRVLLDWIHILYVPVRGKWRMQMAELSKAIKETRRARRRPPKRDLKSFSSFMTRSRLGIINQSMEICIRFIWYIYICIWGIFTSGNTRFNHIGKLEVSKSLFDLPLKRWVHFGFIIDRKRERERGENCILN